MTWREKFDLFVGTYVAALGSDKIAMMRQQAIKDGLSVIVHASDISAPDAAYEFVAWKFGLGSKPTWVTPPNPG